MLMVDSSPMMSFKNRVGKVKSSFTLVWHGMTSALGERAHLALLVFFETTSISLHSLFPPTPQLLWVSKTVQAF